MKNGKSIIELATEIERQAKSKVDAAKQRADCVARTSADREQRHVRQDAAYIAHAANAYPRLVEQLGAAAVALKRAGKALGDQGELAQRVDTVRFESVALLSELGESK